MRLGLGLGIPYSLGGPEAAAFSPLDLSPVLWLDASDTSTITEVGNAVSQWDDKSGNGYHLTQATAAAQPKSGTATINSLNVIEYDGADTQTMGNTAVDLSGTTKTLFIVTEIAASETFYALIGHLANGTGYALAGDNSANQISTWTSTTIHVDGVVLSVPTRNDFYTALGNSPALVRLVGTPDEPDLHIGYPIIQYRLGYGTKVAELIVVDGTLTAGEITATEQYLANKWGITI